MTSLIYILRLANKKWYVGKSDNVKYRIMQHVNGTGSTWTALHTVKKVEKITIGNCESELLYTLRYMAKYDPENVRGGPFCQYELKKETINEIHNMINFLRDKCYVCGGVGHYSKDCPFKTRN